MVVHHYSRGIWNENVGRVVWGTWSWKFFVEVWGFLNWLIVFRVSFRRLTFLSWTGPSFKCFSESHGYSIYQDFSRILYLDVKWGRAFHQRRLISVKWHEDKDHFGSSLAETETNDKNLDSDFGSNRAKKSLFFLNNEYLSHKRYYPFAFFLWKNIFTEYTFWFNSRFFSQNFWKLFSCTEAESSNNV